MRLFAARWNIDLVPLPDRPLEVVQFFILCSLIIVPALIIILLLSEGVELASIVAGQKVVSSTAKMDDGEPWRTKK